ncbi:MAG TPA: hypothetical protein PK819_07145 [Thermomicrobiales bacterium]|nr:hypothetical protein [Thermomicrobiales bacterium]
MTKLRVQLEHGLKGKRAAAVAMDWPGLSRGGKTPDTAVALIATYIPRYAPIAELAGMGTEFVEVSGVEVIEEYTGTGSTDFWGISFGFGPHDHAPMTAVELERELCLMQAAWLFFDQVRGRVSAEMQKGPRGGGRDREKIVGHTLIAELDWMPKLGIKEDFADLQTPEGLATHRDRSVATIRAYHAESKSAKKWPLRYLIRHTAFHTLDHAWEMEDKDLSGQI